MSMQNTMQAIAMIAVVLFLVAYFLIEVITNINSDSFSQSFEVGTGVGETSADVTLSQEHYYSTTEGMSVVSGSPADTPAIINYVDLTEVVTIGGLVAGGTRVITVNYVTESYYTDMFPGWGPFMYALPALIVLLALWRGWQFMSK